MQVLQIKLSNLDSRSLTTYRGLLTNPPAPHPRHLIRQKAVTHTSDLYSARHHAVFADQHLFEQAQGSAVWRFCVSKWLVGVEVISGWQAEPIPGLFDSNHTTQHYTAHFSRYLKFFT